MENPVNEAFVSKWKAYAKAKNLPGADKAVTNDPMEATYVGIHMWAQAVEKAGSTGWTRYAMQSPGRPSRHRAATPDHGREEPPPAQAGDDRRGPEDGQFSVVWETESPVRAQPWSPYIPGNDKPDYAVKSN